MESHFNHRHLEELCDELEPADAAVKGQFRGRVAAAAAAARQPIQEEEMMDDDDPELEALANGAADVGDGTGAREQQLQQQQQSRAARKARRVNRAYSIGEEGKFGSSHHGAAERNLKNSRKSRSGLGRGLPKKGKSIYFTVYT